MGERKAFFYGTLMAPQVLHRVIYGTTTPTPLQLSLLTIRPALLPHYTRHRVCDCDYPAIVPSSEEGACVRGTYVQGLTEGDQWRLDVFEGDQYTRLKVKARLLKESEAEDTEEEEEVEAETYVWVDEETGLEKGEWDFDVFRREKMGRWIGGSAEYEEVDEAVREQKDPTGGRGVKGHIGGQLEQKMKVDDKVLESAV